MASRIIPVPTVTAKDIEAGSTISAEHGPAGESTSGEAESSLPVGGLERVLSRVSHLSRTSISGAPEPPPNGGARAWTQVLMCHLVIFCTWGYINSFGVFQTVLGETLKQPPSTISWIGSIQIFLVFAVGTFSGRASDAGYFRLCFVCGGILQVLGVFMTSLGTQYWHLLLAQGICTGIGNGLIFCPTVALAPTYFSTRRSVAIAIVASGTATGGMILPAIIESLLPRIGFGWTVRVVGFVMLIFTAIAGTFLRPRIPPRRSGPIIEFAAFKEPAYAWSALGAFWMFVGVYPAFYFVGEYAATVLHLPQADSINLLLIMNGVGIAGRIAPGYVADYTGPINLLIPGALSTAVIIYAWNAVTTRTGLFVFAASYGIPASLLQGLFPAALSSLTTDVTKLGVRMGMIFSIVGCACLIGSPIAGALITRGQGNFLYAQLFAGTSLVLASVAWTMARIASAGCKLRVKV